MHFFRSLSVSLLLFSYGYLFYLTIVKIQIYIAFWTYQIKNLFPSVIFFQEEFFSRIFFLESKQWGIIPLKPISTVQNLKEIGLKWKECIADSSEQTGRIYFYITTKEMYNLPIGFNDKDTIIKKKKAFKYLDFQYLI